MLEQITTDGYIFAAALNDQTLYRSLQSQFEQKPYLQPPRAAVFYIKTPNTRSYSGDEIVQQDHAVLYTGATVGVVIGRTTFRIAQAQAMQCIAGYMVVNDLSLKERDYYRFDVREKCQDGFCVCGDVVAKNKVTDIADLTLQVFVNGTLKQTAYTADWIRSPAELIEEISTYMILQRGDIILTGTALGRVAVRAGDQVRIEIDQLGAVENLIVAAGDQ